MGLRVGHTHDLVIYSKFYQNLFKGFGVPGGPNLPFPIALAIGFYNRLYYHTSCDLLFVELCSHFE